MKGFLAVGAVAAFALVGSFFTMKSTNAAQNDSTSEFEFVQVDENEYSGTGIGGMFWNYYDGYKTVLATSDKTFFKVILEDGSVGTIQNVNGEYKNVYEMSDSSSIPAVKAINQDNKTKILTPNGKGYFGMEEFHDAACFTSNASKGNYVGSYYTKDGNQYKVYDKLGNVIGEYTFDNDVRNVIVCDKGVEFIVCEDGKEKIVLVDNTGKTTELIENYNSIYGNEYCHSAYTSSDNKLVGYYFDADCNEISRDEYYELQKKFNSPVQYSVTASPTAKALDKEGFSGNVFSKTVNGIDLLIAAGTEKGYKGYGVFDANGHFVRGNMQLVSVNSGLFVEYNKDEDGKSYFKLYTIVKKGEKATIKEYVDPTDDNGSSDEITDVVISSETVIQPKEDGSVEVTVTLKSEDGTEEKVEFKAEEGVIPAGSIMDVLKIVSGETVENAKKVIEEISNKLTVYEIDLYNSENVKIQPNGNIKFTLDVPSGYDTNKINVYRIETDGTYTNMNASIVDGKVVFETNHFSTYVISEDKVARTDATPSTGDSRNIILFAVLAMTALSVLMIQVRREVR